MNKKQSTLLTLTMIALLVGIINGIFDIAYNMQRTFEASVANDYGESLSVKVVVDSGRPPLVDYFGQKLYKSWWLAWRVGTTPVSTVNLGISIVPSGTNVVDMKVTYYVKGVSGANSNKFLSATNYPASNGVEITNSTGDVDIDTHLSAMGLSTTQDQTVDYMVYCRVEATGAISGETLIMEIPETQFDTITFDYGGVIQTSTTLYTIADAYVFEALSDMNWGSETWLYSQSDIGGNVRSFLKFDISSISGTITDARLRLYCAAHTDGISGVTDVEARGVTDDSWSESGITWNNQPSYGDVEDMIYPVAKAWNEWNVTSFVQSQSDDYVSFCLKNVQESYDSTERYTQYHSKENTYDPELYIEYEYIDWSLSWNWLNLPLSIVSLPIGQQFIAILFMILAFAVWAVAREKKRKKRRRRR